MRIYYLIIVIVFAGLLACNRESTYPLNNYKVDYDGLLDTIIPHFAKLHDSIPDNQRFLPKNKQFMLVHKVERQYEWMHYTEEKDDGYCYFMVSRLEPSIKNDKYASICGRFKRDKFHAIDSASYEELFWTWKMLKPQLKEKSLVLFRQMVEKGNVDEFLPGVKQDEWIMFPDNNVYYDKTSQSWKSKQSY